MIKEISSSANPLIKQLRSLASSKKARQQEHCFLIETSRAIDTFLSHRRPNYTLSQLLLSKKWLQHPLLKKAQAQFANLEMIQLPDFLFEKITDACSSQGILAVVQHHPLPLYIHPERGNYLLLDGIRDPGNLGTMIRSAVGAGFSGILLMNDCVEPFNPKVVRSTMGTLTSTDIWPLTPSELQPLLELNYTLCVTTGLGGTNLHSIDFGPKNLLVIGSEAHGVSKPLLQHARTKVTIPLDPRCESLNAAVAAGICMFQIKHASGA